MGTGSHSFKAIVGWQVISVIVNNNLLPESFCTCDQDGIFVFNTKSKTFCGGEKLTMSCPHVNLEYLTIDLEQILEYLIMDHYSNVGFIKQLW